MEKGAGPKGASASFFDGRPDVGNRSSSGGWADAAKRPSGPPNAVAEDVAAGATMAGRGAAGRGAAAVGGEPPDGCPTSFNGG